jgi:probable poly-beta-1,6-N-acetyl-D-glucosamine export protein
MFLKSINNFRAVAILIIIAGHCMAFSWNATILPEKIMANLLVGGTTLFVFISGFLFHHVYYHRYNYNFFLKKKVQNVLIPYFLLASLAIVAVIMGWIPPWSKRFLPQNFSGQPIEWAWPIIQYLWTGSFLLAYWYIPFIMVTFLMAPLHVIFVKFPVYIQLLLIGFLLAISMLIQRPIADIGMIQNVVYFLPVYLLGMLSSIHKDKIYTKLENKELYILIIVVLCATIQAIFCTQTGNFEKKPFSFNGIDIQLIQKLFMSYFFLILFHRWENIQNKTLELLASASFALYFIHPWYIILYKNIACLQPINLHIPGMFIFPILTIIVICASLITAKAIKWLFPSHSRQIIGW